MRQNLLEGGLAFNCESFHIARTLLRAGDERPKPNGERLREFSEAGKESLELELFSEKPIYSDLEILTLADSLTFFASYLGADDPLVQAGVAESGAGTGHAGSMRVRAPDRRSPLHFV